MSNISSLMKKVAENFKHREKARIPYLRQDHYDRLWEPGAVITEKLDGALTHIYLRNNRPSGLQSHRISKRTGKPIDYTPKIPGIENTEIPKGLKTDELDLKGEFVILDQWGRTLPHQEISGILNSKTDRALDTIKTKKLIPKVGLFDIWEDDRPYSEKYKTLEQIAHKNPDHFFVPDKAESEQDKKVLFERIKTGLHPRTIEGVVLEGKAKVKFKNLADVYIKSFFETKVPGGKYEGNAIGGINYALTANGLPVGKVGTGFSDEVRRDFFKNYKDYIGKRIRIEHQGQYKGSGAYRTPAFKQLLD